MPLPAPTERKLLHRRTIVCRGYERTDGKVEVDSTVTDIKTHDHHVSDQMVPAGTPLHAMALRLTVGDALTISDAAAVTDHAPFAVCPAIAPSFAGLIGVRLVKGFSQTVRELFGGIKGCVHIVDLIGPAATTAYQTLGRKWRTKMESGGKDKTVRPGFINTCHIWSTDSPIVKRDFPQLYTGK